MNISDRHLQASCARSLSGHRVLAPRAMLTRLAEHAAADEQADYFADGGAAALLEQRGAALLGKPSARFFIKGMIAQMCVLRVLAERAGTPNVALHPLSHIDYDEEGAPWRLHGLQAVRLGRCTPFTRAALDAVTEPLAVVVVELPLRRAGYRLPPLDELRAISAWCRDRGIPLHFDGARIWEAAAGYGVQLAELAGLADSVYVSLYKGMGGLGGALVTGEETFLRALSIWQTRHGGNLLSVYPYAISALAGIDRHLPRMDEYVRRARALASALAAVDCATITPAVPHVNAFHLLFEGSVDKLADRNRRFAEKFGIWLFNAFYESPVDGHSIAEVVIGDRSDEFQIAEAAQWIADFAGNKLSG